MRRRPLLLLLILPPVALAWVVLSNRVSSSDVDRLVGEGAFLLDVRSGEEFQSGHIPGARHIHYRQLHRRLDELPTDRNEPIVIYCHAGVRSAWAALLLRLRGHRRVYDFGGGTRRWAIEDRPFAT